ncbi:hypothetical protein BWR19_07890 [Halomonas sp. 1513]|nr:EAL domain-containing protein [Halomonas sp. 1513]APX92857.1 hypothetical protein BWR19_07890 [Halomonas sp. 1513]
MSAIGVELASLLLVASACVLLLVSTLVWRSGSRIAQLPGPHASSDAPRKGTPREQQVAEALESALAQDQPFFELFLQPQLGLAQRDVLGAEVLIRWQHARLGFISPAEFIPIAEHSGLIETLDEQVFEASLRVLAAAPTAPGFALAINFSIQHFTDLTFPGRLLDRCRQHGVSPSSIDIEITEHVSFFDLETIKRVMSLLRHHGFGIALDDFGSGYTSLRFLQNLPFTKVKLDKLFIDPIDSEQRSRALVKSLIGMADSLGLKAVAEGIETHGQLEQLRKMGCPIGQGYLLGRPQPLDEFFVVHFGQDLSLAWGLAKE